MIQYCLLSLICATFFYFALSTTGFDRIYRLFLHAASIDIEEIETLLEDDETADELRRTKLIVFSETGNSAGDLAVALNMVKLTDQIKQADIWIEQIPNSEASFINRYLKSKNSFYLAEGLFDALHDDYNRYREIALRLSESEILRNKSYSVAGLACENSLHAQLTNIRMLIEETKNNPIREELAEIFNRTDVSDAAYMQAIAQSLSENEAMYKEHFLTKYQDLTTAIRAYHAYTAEEYSMADTFCNLYREMPTETFIVSLEGGEAAAFIDAVASRETIFQKRHFLIEAFDYTENKDIPPNVRIIDTAKMKLADAYGRFVYRLSGKQFQPTPRETGRYYIRIENAA